MRFSLDANNDAWKWWVFDERNYTLEVEGVSNSLIVTVDTDEGWYEKICEDLDGKWIFVKDKQLKLERIYSDSIKFEMSDKLKDMLDGLESGRYTMKDRVE